MNMFEAEYAQQDREHEMREAVRVSELKKLLAPPPAQAKNDSQSVRDAVGGKLVEWGERLQAQTNSANPASSEI